MAQFDPYHAWLGITPSNQLLDHYRLLGLRPFESDPRVIEEAANQRIAYVSSFQTGVHAAESRHVLQHLNFARGCLLDAPQKSIYDQQLRFQQTSQEPLDAMLVEPSGKSQQGQQRSSGLKAIVGISLAIVVLIAAGISIFAAFRPDPFEIRSAKSDSRPVELPRLPIERPSEQRPSGDAPASDESLSTDASAEVESLVGTPAPKERLSIAIKRALDASKKPVENVAETDDPAGKTISVLNLLPEHPISAGGSSYGTWDMVDRELHAKDGGIVLPIDPPYDYQLDFTIEHLQEEGHVVIGFPVIDSRAAIVIDWEVNGESVTGFHWLDRKDANDNDSTYRGRLIQNGQPAQVRVRVRGDQVKLTVDGKSVIDWKGDPRRLMVSTHWGAPGKRPAFLGVTGEIRISKIEFTPYLKSVVPPRGEPVFALTPFEKLPAPVGEELGKARAAARKLYEDVYAESNDSWSRRQLAYQMWMSAYHHRDEPQLAYGLYYEAYELASTSFQGEWAARYALDRSLMFDIDRFPLQVQAYQRGVSDITSDSDDDQVQSLARGIYSEYEDSLQEERFDMALKLAELLKKLNSRKRFPELKRFIDRRLAEAKFARELYDSANIYRDAAGDDLQTPQAKLALGKYLCFAAGSWDVGLPLLAESGDEGLTAVAQLELSGDPRLERPIADGWHELALKANKPWKDEYLRQARYWYEQLATDPANRELRTKVDRSVGMAKNRLKPGIVSTFYTRTEKGLLRRAFVESQLYRLLGDGSPDSSVPNDDHLSVWTGYIHAPLPGKYRFTVTSDDGSRLKLDGVTLWDEVSNGAGERSHEVDLTGEPQLIEVAHHDLGGGSFCALQWAPVQYSEAATLQADAFSHDVRFAKKMHADEEIVSYNRTVDVPTDHGNNLFCIFEDQPSFEANLTQGGARPTYDRFDRYSGDVAICIPNDQRYGSGSFGLRDEAMAIRENPGPGQYRYLRLAWKKPSKTPMGIQMYVESKKGVEPRFADWKRLHVGHRADEFPIGGSSIQISEEVPAEWTVVTRDLAKDFGEVDIRGIALSSCDNNFALFDHIYLARNLEDFDKLGKVNTPTAPAKSE